MGLEAQVSNLKNYDVEINIINDKDETISNKIVTLKGVSKQDVAIYILNDYLEKYQNGDFSSYKSPYVISKLKNHYFEIVSIEEKQGEE